MAAGIGKMVPQVGIFLANNPTIKGQPTAIVTARGVVISSSSKLDIPLFEMVETVSEISIEDYAVYYAQTGRGKQAVFFNEQHRIRNSILHRKYCQEYEEYQFNMHRLNTKNKTQLKTTPKKGRKKMRLFKRKSNANVPTTGALIDSNDEEPGFKAPDQNYLINVATKDVKISKPNDSFLIFEEKTTLTLEVKASDQPRITIDFLSDMKNRWGVPDDSYLEVATQEHENPNGQNIGELHIIRFTWSNQIKTTSSSTESKEE